MSGEMRAVAMGVHVLDVLVRPVEAIPEGRAASWSSRSGSPPRARPAAPL